MNLILLRHGQSTWNLENRFTGWKDVSLTEIGIEEAEYSGKILLENQFNIQSIYTSLLNRATETTNIVAQIINYPKSQIKKDWRLNERHYGALEGLNKSETAKKYGDEQVLIWRRSYDIPPPPLSKNDKRHPKYDILYKNVKKSLLPKSESLKDTLERVKPLWFDQIQSKLKNGDNVLIVAHGNSLRAIVKMIKNLSSKEVLKLNIPTGIPYLFNIDDEINVVNDYYIRNED